MDRPCHPPPLPFPSLKDTSCKQPPEKPLPQFGREGREAPSRLPALACAPAALAGGLAGRRQEGGLVWACVWAPPRKRGGSPARLAKRGFWRTGRAQAPERGHLRSGRSLPRVSPRGTSRARLLSAPGLRQVEGGGTPIQVSAGNRPARLRRGGKAGGTPLPGEAGLLQRRGEEEPVRKARAERE